MTSAPVWYTQALPMRRRRLRATTPNGSIRILPAGSARNVLQSSPRSRPAHRSTYGATRSRPIASGRSPFGLRIRRAAEAKSPAIHAERAFIKGMIEVQDEGSQLAALLAGARPGEQVVDLCAGGGGKTLALAAMMENRGQIYATDDDKRRLSPIHARLVRAGARNVQVRPPKYEADALADLAGRADLVLIDAPCTGTGVWRRNPDAKWRMRPGALD